MRKFISFTGILISLLVLSGCSPKVEPCPKQQYPDIQLIDKVPYEVFEWSNTGELDFNSTQRLGKQNMHFRINEHYYRTSIMKYREEFILKKDK